MPLSIATVAEGSTDHPVLENLLLGLCKQQQLESGDITPVQPLLDETGKQQADALGGWQQVFRWLEDKRYHEAFQFNDHVVVHIDTGTCEEPGFDVCKTVNGVALTPEQLVQAIRVRLNAIIGTQDLQTYAGRFHFAIAVHDIECWLLPLWGRPNERGSVHTCKQRVDNGLTRAKKRGLHKDDVLSYARASSAFRKRKQVLGAAAAQKSLALFCDSLVAVCP